MTVKKPVQAFELERGMAVLLAIGTDKPPTEFLIFAKGTTKTTKGPIVFDDQAARDVMLAFEEHGADKLPFDVAHSMFSPFAPPDGHKAFGWFTPEVRDDGLWASQIEWTKAGEQGLENREFRFFSPAVLRDIKSGRVTQLLNIALTNIPATRNQKPLVADQNENPPGLAPEKEKSRMELEQFLKLLGASDAPTALARHSELTSLNTGLLALTGAQDVPAAMATLSGWKTQAQEAGKLATKVQELEAASANAARDAIITKLSQEGKLAPALTDWAKTQTFAQLEAFGKVAPVAPAATPELKEPKGEGQELTTLSKVERDVCRQAGLSHEDFLKEKKRLAELERNRMQEVA